MGRFTVALASLFALGAMLSAGVSAETAPRHALSLIGEPEYGPDFEHFHWVNPDAPKGGTVRMSAIGTFDTLNQFPVRGTAAAGLGLLYDSLMVTSPDEPSTEYGLVAESVTYPDDFSSVTFTLRPEARFHDGEPIEPDDVIFSLEAITSVNPNYRFYYQNVTGAEQTGEREVTFTFNVSGNRELPQIVGQLPILPKHYWDDQDRNFEGSTLEPPLGSGPYRVGDVTSGRSIVFERVEDYWARDLPVYRGQWNFDRLRFEYFRDATIAFEAFKAGQLDYFQETSAKNWAQGYDFPAMRQEQVVKEEIELETPQPMQAFVFNTRRDRFADPRVRRAFNLAFDFEWANTNLFFDQYRRTSSYFENQELAATGLPAGRERELLEEVRAAFPDHVPEAALTEEFANPANDDRRALRRHLGEAARLLEEAGWEVRNNALTNVETGEQMSVEFLLVSPQFERIVLPYSQNLQRLGIRSSIRLVDTSQYQRRIDSFDFDIITAVFPQSASPGNEQRDFWGSEAADMDGSRNLIGVRNPAVDALIDRIIFADSREELVAATRALDRVLLWNHYVVPQWYSPSARIAYWNKFDRPEVLPSQQVAFTRVWWWDEEAAAKLAQARR